MNAAKPLISMIFLAMCIPLSFADDKSKPSNGEIQANYVVRFAPDTYIPTVTITSKGKGVSWADVMGSLARAKGFDDGALQGLLPDAKFKPGSTGGKWTIFGLNAVLRPSVVISTFKDDRGETGIRIALDRVAQLSTKRRFKKWLQGKLLGLMKRQPTDFGVSADKDWHKAPLDKSLVVVLHGLQSSPVEVEDVCKDLRKAGHPCAVFKYPNDQALAASAKLLSKQLEKIASFQPDRRVALLTHSMGGLVARAVIEDDLLDPGNVSHLIMVAPPTHGSQLAQFAFSLEIAEYARVIGKKQKMDQLYRRVEDGLADAADDLEPGSPFLKKLNMGKRNPVARYTIILGAGGFLTEEDLALMKKKLLSAGQTNRFVRFFGGRLESALSDLDEVVAGKGDGVVAVKRGRLEGVDDVVIMDFIHSGVLIDIDTETERKLRKTILNRLGQ